MPPTEAAQRNHDELFPRHVSTLAKTDPELIEYFDNFAFDEVLRHGELDPRTRLVVQLASMIASQAVSEYRVMLGAALAVGVTPVEVKEIVYGGQVAFPGKSLYHATKWGIEGVRSVRTFPDDARGWFRTSDLPRVKRAEEQSGQPPAQGRLF